MERKRPIRVIRNGWMAAAVVILAAAFLSLNWYYYRKIRSSLEEEFGIRLRAIASLAAQSAMEGSAGSWETGSGAVGTADSLSAALRSIEKDFDISSIAILGEDGTVILSTRPGIFPPGELYPLWNMDFEEIVSALEGTPASTETYETPGGDYLMAGYAPVGRPGTASSAVAAVEADADFLEGLSDLRNILIAATSLSIVGAIVFVWLVIRATASLLRARESLLSAENLASMGRMAAGIAHEVRNPLFIIRSSAEKLKAAHPESAGDIDEFILEEVDRLSGILTDYLLFAREERGRFQETDLATVIRRSTRLVSESASAAGVSLVERLDTPSAPVMGEEKRLQQVLMNILINAAEACGDGGTVSVRLSGEGSLWKTVISDDGRGIPSAEIGKVFEPFFTSKPAGSGLGLAVARSIIEEHSGTISIVSAEGEGTVVTVTLPASTASRGVDDDQSPGSR